MLNEAEINEMIPVDHRAGSRTGVLVDLPAFIRFFQALHASMKAT
jgi:hypothetical protein